MADGKLCLLNAVKDPIKMKAVFQQPFPESPSVALLLRASEVVGDSWNGSSNQTLAPNRGRPTDNRTHTHTYSLSALR